MSDETDLSDDVEQTDVDLDAPNTDPPAQESHEACESSQAAVSESELELARLEAKKAKAEAAKEKAKAKEKSAARRDKNRRAALKAFNGLSKGPKIAIVVVVCAALIGVVALLGLSLVKVETHPVGDAQLMKVVAISKLNTAQMRYDGVTTKEAYVGDMRAPIFDYMVKYTATVTSTVDFDKVRFVHDDANKVIYPIVPDPVIAGTSVDAGSLSFLNEPFDLDMGEALSLCEEDAKNEAANSARMREAATKNAQKAIEGLTKSILDEAGYTISWDQAAATKLASEQQVATTQAGGEQQ